VDAAEPHPLAVRLMVTNRSSERLRLVLEPAGEICMLEPGESRTVTYADDPDPRLSIDPHDDEMMIWAEGSGTLTLG
jgi:hypothetical protein